MHTLNHDRQLEWGKRKRDLSVSRFEDNLLDVFLDGLPTGGPALNLWLRYTGVGFNPETSFVPGQILIDQLSGGWWSVDVDGQTELAWILNDHFHMDTHQ